MSAAMWKSVEDMNGFNLDLKVVTVQPSPKTSGRFFH